MKKLSEKQSGSANIQDIVNRKLYQKAGEALAERKKMVVAKVFGPKIFGR